MAVVKASLRGLVPLVALWIGGAALAEQPSQYALHFDGEGEGYVETEAFGFGAGNAITYAAWILLEGAGRHNFGSMYEDANHVDSAFTVRVEGRRIRFFTSDGRGAFFETSSGSNLVGLGNWHHVAVTHERGRQRVYLDGVVAGETAHDHAMGAVEDGLLVGRDGRGRHPFRGKIDDVRLFSRALSKAEVQQLYARRSRAAVNGGLEVWLRLDEGAGGTARDASGQARHGTVSGADWAETAPPILYPTIQLRPDSNISGDSAEVHGEVSDLGDFDAVTVFFRWKRRPTGDPIGHVNERSFRDGRQIVLDGDYSYVAGGHNTDGLGIFRVGDSAGPSFAGLIGETTRIGHGIAKRGDHVFVSGRRSGSVEVFDVSDPQTPVVVGAIEDENYQGMLGLCIVDDTLYAGLAGDHDPAVAENPTGFIAFDISDPGHVEETYFQTEGVGSLQYPVADEQGTYLYVSAYRDDRIAVYDITDRERPEHVLSTSFEGYDNGRGIEIAGDILYLADQSGMLLSVDISDREAPVLVDALSHPSMAGAREIRLDAEREVMYVAGRSSNVVAVLDVSDPEELEHLGEIAYETFDNPYGLAFDAERGLLHVSNADHTDGVYQVAQPDHHFGRWCRTEPETVAVPRVLSATFEGLEAGATYVYQMVIRYGDAERAGETRTFETAAED